MSEPLLNRGSNQVAPLELFFDLVFVFAVSQLWHQLAGNLTPVGASQTAVLLCAVFSIWSFGSFGVLFASGARVAVVTIFAELFLSLFINAAIPRAFTAQVAVFLVPFLAARFGQVLQADITASSLALRRHHRAVFVWVSMECTLWIVGGLEAPERRLAWWATAALVAVAGNWTSHRLPGRVERWSAEPFAPGHMVERSRLLLLIALGETVLSIGTAVAGAEITLANIATAVLALTATSLLWLLYFVTSDPIVNAAAAASTDSIRVARIAVNAQLLVLAGLIAIAVAAEIAIESPLETAGLPFALTLHGGVLLYLATQTWYLHALSGRWSRTRIVGSAVLLVTVPLTAASAPLLGVLLTCLVLAAVVVGARRRPLSTSLRTRAPSDRS